MTNPGVKPDIVVLGLSLASSWGNGHATTYRALLGGLHRLGRHVLFLEREVPWYASNRDLADPDFCRLEYYHGVDDLRRRFGGAIAEAEAVVVGSYVPDGVQVIDLVQQLARVAAFYDIDTPVTLARLEAGDEEYLARRQVPGFAVYLSFSGGPILERIERVFGARRAEALYCSVDEIRYGPTGEAPRWEFGYLGTHSPDRQPALEELLLEPARRMPDLRFVVAGPQYPPAIRWPDNVERIEHLPPAAHPSFYSRQRFTLNVTRADMVEAGWSPSVRLFEAAACGTPILSDTWEGLDDLLPDGEAILTVRSAAEVIEALRRGEAERRAIGAAARERVLHNHTGVARARELLGHLALGNRGAAPGVDPVTAAV